jgi:choline dehydrogenase-like flavoprotein
MALLCLCTSALCEKRSREVPMPVGTPLAAHNLAHDVAHDVIVAGAGPVGSTLAIDLGRRGVRCLLIERSPTTPPLSEDGPVERAHHGVLSPHRHRRRVRALGYPADNPMDVFLTTRLSDPPIAVLKYPSVAGASPADRRRAERRLPAGTLPAGVAEQAGAAPEGGG